MTAPWLDTPTSEPLSPADYRALLASASTAVTGREVADLPDDARTRCATAAAWFMERRPHRMPHRPWTPPLIRAARAKARFHATVLVTYQLANWHVDWLSRELDAVREELSRVRMRAELGSRLAQAWREANEVTDLLAMETAPIPKQRAGDGEASSSREVAS